MNNQKNIISAVVAVVVVICQQVVLAQPVGPGYDLVPDAVLLNPNDQIEITVLMNEPPIAIPGYQADMIETGGTTGTFDIVSISAASTPECDFIFASDSGTFIADAPRATRIAVVHSIGQPQVITGQKCIAIFVYQASADASGVFTFDLHPTFSFIMDQFGNEIPIGPGNAIQVGVGVDCLVDTDCDDSNACTDDTCVSNLCVNTNNDTNNCDDGNACTSNACLAGSCNATNLPSGSSCDDGLACTGTDTCDGAGVCDHSGNSCKSGEVCTECPFDAYCCATPPLQCACTYQPW